MDKAKPFNIPKREVWEAFKKVKANQGAAGVDGQTIAEFEADLSNNLYKLWNRMSSGSYFPPPVRRVDLPKGDGRTRPLGIPTVGDRVAQEVVKRYLEPILEPIFHDDSYGYRPGRSAIDALQKTRQRCWRYDWVLDIDVTELLRQHRLGAVAQGGSQTYGLPMGAALHRALAEGSGRKWRTVASSRVRQGRLRVGWSAPSWLICSCTMLSTCGWRGVFPPSLSRDTRTTSSATAEAKKRPAGYGMPWRPASRPAGWFSILQKTKLVYCKDTNRRGDFPIQSFDFLGYAFRPRTGGLAR